ncbi:unnamed protein product [Periconia digitata]|uniref:DUF336-domain-containing protein n=1 Tax=Periconia digitata TaxID=1303443 RepID=A0A9W4UI03_9PLEO|nr:unnamed protein product [Periconia digitata]
MHFNTTLSSLLLLPLLSLASPNSTSPATKPLTRHVISAAQAQTVIASALSQAAKLSVQQNIAVVDPSGLLVAFQRMDNAYIGSIDISMKKARTSVLFNGGPSAAYYDAVQPGGDLFGVDRTNGGLVVFGGGLPVYVDGELVGGVGVSGGTVEEDVSVVTAAVEGLQGKEQY